MSCLSKAQAALDEAAALINGPRQEAYGHPRENFARLAQRMTQVIGKDVPPHQAAQILAELKLARLTNGFQRDSVVDAIAYLALMMELIDEQA